MVIRVKVKPNARMSRLAQQADGTWIAYVRAAPVDGKANAALIDLAAEHFGIRRAQVSIRRGLAGRLKTLDIDA